MKESNIEQLKNRNYLKRNLRKGICKRRTEEIVTITIAQKEKN